MDRNLPAWAGQYVGIPYVTHGRDRSGVDCWGLVQMISTEQLANPWPPYEGVDWFKGQRAAVIGAHARAYASLFRRVEPGGERIGDAILMRMRGHPFHVGMVLDAGWMIHTSEAAGSVIETYRSMMWNKRIDGFYRYEEA